ncbi:MAG: MbnH family di-heme enzyme [Bryobacteraceae bacterium]
MIPSFIHHLSRRSFHPILAALTLLLAGSAAVAAPPDGSAFEWHLPPGFHAPPVPADNPMSEAKVELGRRLFYDQRMSINGKGSCSTCHLQEYGFADRPDKNVAVGVTGEKHPRRAMPLANVAYFGALTWANPTLKALETQARTPLFGTHPVELGLPEGGAPFLSVVSSDPIYRKMFPEAFPGDPGPYTFDHITRALACFERTLISGRSPYDRYRYQNDQSAISDSAKRGEQLFFHQPTICLPCHGGVTFGGDPVQAAHPEEAPNFFNNGLYNLAGALSFPPNNLGIYEYTHDPNDVGKFRPPSLRNVAVRAPYMHDGSIATLDGVLDHYSAGGRTIASGPLAGDGSKNPNKSRFIGGFTLTPRQRADFIAFLESLTDQEFLHDPRFSDPWKH